MSHPYGFLPSISAYIPCYNNAETLAAVIEGIRGQSIPIDDFFVVDDGSTDDSREIAKSFGVRIVDMKVNQGRGAVRARAMREARHDLVLCCDATNRLLNDFVSSALPRFSDPATAAVIGRIMDLNVKGALGRWRARHLFHQDENIGQARRDNLSTWGTLMRKGPVMEVGNFNERMRFGEDFELGQRLAAAGYSIWFDPALIVVTEIQNTLSQTMERYLRWHVDKAPELNFSDFINAQRVAFRILAPIDLRQGDPLAALISLSMPYYKIVHCRHFKKISAWRESMAELPK